MQLFLDEVKPCNESPFFPCMIVVQARMGSTRLPGKVLKTVHSKPLLAYQVERLRRVRGVEGIVIATTTGAKDQPIVDFCNREGLHYIRASEDDVLSRYIAACNSFGLEVVVRVTADCPLIDHELLTQGLTAYRKHYESLDYLSICHPRTFPVGMDFEIMRVDALKRAFYEATSNYDKEHVTPYIWSHPELFRLANLEKKVDTSSCRLTVDTEEDFVRVAAILEELYPKKRDFTLTDIMELIEQKQWI